LSLESAHVLVLYGKALLASGTRQNAILAQERVGQAIETPSTRGTQTSTTQVQSSLFPYSDERDDGHHCCCCVRGSVASTSKAHIAFEDEPDFREIEALDAGIAGQETTRDPQDTEGPSNGKAADQLGAEPTANVEDDVEGDEDKDAKQEGDAGEENEEGEEEQQPQDDDLVAAWEVLDLARTIYARIDSVEAKVRVADMYLLLGDISMESGESHPFPVCWRDGVD
jgi:hypothetical protein